jgi:hypothetical protein
MIQFIAAKGLTPMFGLSRVKQSLISKFLGDSSGITFGGASADEAAETSTDETVLESVAPEISRILINRSRKLFRTTRPSL